MRHRRKKFRRKEILAEGSYLGAGREDQKEPKHRLKRTLRISFQKSALSAFVRKLFSERGQRIFAINAF